MANQEKKSSRKSQPSPLTPSTQESFDAAIAERGTGSNIYGWDNPAPKPGYYKQGGTHIEVFPKPTESGVLGYAI